jgi:class 3 adenylate cyclase
MGGHPSTEATPTAKMQRLPMDVPIGPAVTFLFTDIEGSTQRELQERTWRSGDIGRTR